MMTNASRFELTLPKGVKDFLPVNAAKIEYLRRTLHDLYDRWGYRPVITPSLEFLDVMERGLGAGLRNKSFKFDDRQSGRLIAFTPDCTPQVARIVATRMRERPLPLRLSYDARVLRHEEQQLGKDREIFQSGVELYGLKSAESDAEMIVMAVESLQALGAEEFTLDIGQVEFSRGIMEQLSLPAQQMQQIQETIERKDLSGLRELLAKTDLDPELSEQILLLPRLFGGREVLDRAEVAVSNKRSREAIANLRAVLETLEVYGVEESVTFDLGVLCNLEYHTGITFDGYLSGVGQAVCSGGRYDNLTAAFGEPIPATGFTFNLLNLLFALDQKLDEVALKRTDILIFQPDDDKSTAQRLAQTLRRQGYSVARDMLKRDLEQTLDYATKMNYRFVMLIGPDNKSVTLRTVSDGSEQTITIAAILAGRFDV
ncbi:MAG: ATP phosphoribosyltransferase regulatory subunit [Desulfuromonadales bacterium]|nr:ATP phosphoribosyltransferase regulatory subunit [Desulfuromonadales bacterium]